MLSRRTLPLILVPLCLARSAAAQLSPGPDVLYLDLTTTSVYGPVGPIHAYSLGSTTCNRGDQELLWTEFGSPAMAMNLYRLYDGRLEHIGLSGAKTATFASLFGSCTEEVCAGPAGDRLGPGCIDVYTSSWNATQARLAPRSAINPWTGQVGPIPPGGSFTSIDRRLQVATSDLIESNFPGALYFAEGVYVAADEHGVNGNLNKRNNASYRRVEFNQSTFRMDFPAGGAEPMHRGLPAIYAWRDHGRGPNTPDPDVVVQPVDVPGEGRFYVAHKVDDNGDGTWRYTYAVFNQNSDLAASSWRIPVRPGATVTNVNERAPAYHSGEPYPPPAWSSPSTGVAVVWTATQTYAENPNADALRWGTMRTFWFDADRPPAPGVATLRLFKDPSIELSVTVAAPVAGCPADWDNDGAANSNDISAFLTTWLAELAGESRRADVTGDHMINSNDISAFLTLWLDAVQGGC